MSGIIGLINVSAATVGASEVKSIWVENVSSTSRVTLITPTSGTKVRIISANLISTSSNICAQEVYFGTGTNITTTPANAIYEGTTDADHTPSLIGVWPDGGGPVGAVDAVVSIRANHSVNSNRWIVQYREE